MPDDINTRSRLQSLTKNELIDIIVNHNNNIRSELKEVLESVKLLREDNKRLEEKLDRKNTEISDLTRHLTQCFDIVRKQQYFLESCDSELRKKN